MTRSCALAEQGRRERSSNPFRKVPAIAFSLHEVFCVVVINEFRQLGFGVFGADSKVELGLRWGSRLG